MRRVGDGATSRVTDDAAGIDPALGFVPTESKLARREMLRQLSRSPPFVIRCLVIGFWVVWTVAGARLTPQDPFAVSDAILQPPSWSHWFGTDALGRDVFARVLIGGTDMLTVAPAAALIGVVAGALIGMIVGYVGGFIDDVVGRLMGAVLALPLLVLAVVMIDALSATGFEQTPYFDATTSKTMSLHRGRLHACGRSHRACDGSDRAGTSITFRPRSCRVSRRRRS